MHVGGFRGAGVDGSGDPTKSDPLGRRDSAAVRSKAAANPCRSRASSTRRSSGTLVWRKEGPHRLQDRGLPLARGLSVREGVLEDLLDLADMVARELHSACRRGAADEFEAAPDLPHRGAPGRARPAHGRLFAWRRCTRRTRTARDRAHDEHGARVQKSRSSHRSPHPRLLFVLELAVFVVARYFAASLGAVVYEAALGRNVEVAQWRSSRQTIAAPHRLGAGRSSSRGASRVRGDVRLRRPSRRGHRSHTRQRRGRPRRAARAR